MVRCHTEIQIACTRGTDRLWKSSQMAWFRRPREFSKRRPRCMVRIWNQSESTMCDGP